MEKERERVGNANTDTHARATKIHLDDIRATGRNSIRERREGGKEREREIIAALC